MALRTVLVALWPFLLCFDFVFTTSFYTVRKLRQARQARTLTYLPTAPTRLQFIGGIGIPVEDLAYESVTSGYVLKAEYFLPEKAEDYTPTYLKPQSVNRRSFGDNEYDNSTITHAHAHDASSNALKQHHANFHTNLKNKQKTASTYRWLIYRAMEILMDRAGLAGRECMLRSICEHAAVPLHYDSGILGEILHIILTPSRSRDEFGNPNDGDYGRAERIGWSGGDCEAAYTACTYAPIELITTIFELKD
ncbi:uncharacterized protein LOC101452171 [Ceratitis capitata]|uniref:uncharacterized protein LOC101452171 n=1 Tax=Ceratitis capitata TaxID=7213 RepID=UPI0006188755|nr:uncharacterized protein LOC101452171 [Ceratitis capitata]